MKVETRFYKVWSYWNAVGKILRNNEHHGYGLLCENRGSMIAVARNLNSIYIQIGSWTLEYRVQ